jgi:phospholipid-transporting ATPase
MLTKAAIGVGINGKEGKAAVQAADVGVPEFKYLKRLLFYYGCELCRKNATLVKYNFYKNFVYALPQLVFGVFSRFTGCYIYENTLSQLFNLLYSTLPIIIFALFDQ